MNHAESTHCYVPMTTTAANPWLIDQPLPSTNYIAYPVSALTFLNDQGNTLPPMKLSEFKAMIREIVDEALREAKKNKG